MGRNKPQEEAVKNLKLWSNLYAFIMLIGILSLVAEIYIYRKTFMNLYVLVLLTVLPSVISYWLMLNHGHYRAVQVSQKSYFPLILWVPSVGFITSFLFISTNYYLADEENMVVQEYWIKEQTVTKGRKVVPQPIITIEQNGRDRELVFPSDYVKQAAASDRLQLTLKPGFFGYDVIEKQKLITKTSNHGLQ